MCKARTKAEGASFLIYSSHRSLFQERSLSRPHSQVHYCKSGFIKHTRGAIQSTKFARTLPHVFQVPQCLFAEIQYPNVILRSCEMKIHGAVLHGGTEMAHRSEGFSETPVRCRGSTPGGLKLANRPMTKENLSAL
jgi:hypothetical protein